MQVYVLSPEKARLLDQVLQREQNSYVNEQSRPGTIGSHLDTQEQPAPEVYIARPQDTDGIPALDSGVGTGSGSGSDDRPGYGDCDIFTIKKDADGYRLEQVPNFTKRVFNFSTSVIPYEYISIKRTKFGHWVPATGGGFSCSSLESISGYSESVQQVLTHNGGGGCFWLDTAACETAGTGTGSV